MARKDKERKLTEAEQKRLERFDATCEEFVAQGYRRESLIVSIVWANVVAIVAAILLLAVCVPLFHMLYPGAELFLSSVELVACLVVFAVLVVLHELVHGFTWSRFTDHGFADISFGIMWNSLTPYCTCQVPLRKGPYICGTLMPLIVFGLVPLAVAFVMGSALLLYIGILMTVSAAGDVMIVVKVLRHPNASDDILVFDHPTEAGSVVFER
jgi:hypothetical protein